MNFDLRLTPKGLLYRGKRFPCSIGQTGLVHTKQEGDGATPIADLRIVDMLYRPDRIRRPCAWAKVIGPNDLWSDDQNSENYNQLVKGPYAFSHERLSRSDPMYDIILVTDWNYPDAIAGMGSAIFIHQWRKPGYPTAGCIALSRKHLWYIATTLRFGATVQITANNPARQK